jgi:hypothetical protein
MGSGSDAGMGSGSDAGMGSGSDGGTTCQGLFLVQNEVPLVPLGTGLAEVRSIPGFTDQLVTASIDNPAFAFALPECTGQVCDFAGAPRALPFALTVRCAAIDGVPHTGTLSVRGAQGAGDVDSATLMCAGGGIETPLISVAPALVDAGDVPVGTATQPDPAFSIINNGTAPLTYSLSPPTAPEWTIPSGACIAPQQCTVSAGGGSASVSVRFTPSKDGESTSAISIASNAGARTVSLIGNGLGSRIVVTDPDDFDLDFGTIPRNSTSTRSIAVSAIGNLPVSLQATAPGAPFTVTPGQLTLSPGIPQAFTVSCGSPTAVPAIDATIGLASPEAYALSTDAIEVHCEVANTLVAVTPAAFDFMEVRKDAPPPVIPFTIENPGPSSATIASVALANPQEPLSLEIDGAPPPRVLAAGETLTGSLALATSDNLDLSDVVPAPELAVSVDGEQLAYPITGKVTTPAAYVTPEKLDLGTACLGTEISATVTMVNSGTARLIVEEPRIDSAFTPEPRSPASYPAMLPAGMTATLGVSPAQQVLGELSGTLTWEVDAPKSPFLVPVRLAYIETGTAVSPASLSFLAVPIHQMSNRSSITLENCNATPSTIVVDGVEARRGPLDAWDVQPRFEERTLAPHDKMTITVAFAPKRHGRHEAVIRLVIDGEERGIPIDGDGVDVDFERTSFYACGCDAPGAPSGWSLALTAGVGILVLRRRRRS